MDGGKESPVPVCFLTWERFPTQVSWEHDRLFSLLTSRKQKREYSGERIRRYLRRIQFSFVFMKHCTSAGSSLWTKPVLCAFLKFSVTWMQIARPSAPGDVLCPVSCSHSRENSLSFRARMFEQRKRFPAICNWQLGRLEAEDWSLFQTAQEGDLRRWMIYLLCRTRDSHTCRGCFFVFFWFVDDGSERWHLLVENDLNVNIWFLQMLYGKAQRVE